MATRRLRWLCAAMIGATCSGSGAVLIDDFSQGPFDVVSYGRPTLDVVQPFLDPAHTIGGERRWERFYHNESTPSAESFTRIRIDPTEGVLDFRSVGPERQSRGYFDLVYGSEEEPLDADLTGDGADRLRFRFRGEGSNPWLFQVTIRGPRVDGSVSSAINWQLATRSVIAGVDPIIELPIPEEPPIDLTRVESIRISVIRYQAGEYFQLDQIETATEPILGDYDRDGDVDAADYGAWREQMPLRDRDFFTGDLTPRRFPIEGFAADGNGDGFINAADYTVWRDAMHDSTPASVPEPGAAFLAGVAILLVGQRRPRQRLARIGRCESVASRRSLLVFAAIAAVAADARGVVIDDFSQGSISFTAFSPYSPYSLDQPVSASQGGPLGGERRWSWIAAAGAEGTSATYAVDSAESVFRTTSVDADDRLTWKYFQIQYGAPDNPLGVDLTAGGADRLRIRFRGDAPGIGFSFEAFGFVEGETRRVRATFGSVWEVGPTDAILEFPFDEMFDDVEALRDVEYLTFDTGRQVANTTIDVFETAGPPMVGDLNRDGAVDPADLAYWQSSYGGIRSVLRNGELVPSTGSGGFNTGTFTADANGDGAIDAADYTVWRDAERDSAPASVPEPMSAVFVGLVVALTPNRRDRR